LLLNDILEERHISKYSLSKRTGIPYMTLNDICSGKTNIEKCTAETIYKLSKELGVSMEALVEPSMLSRSQFEANLKKQIEKVAEKYSVKKVVLFGSRALGTNRENSDVDLIAEFSKPVSIITLSKMKNELEDLLGLNVDLIHGPLEKNDIIKVKKVVEVYAKQG